MNIPDMLELAYFLSILTYYIGVMILALPIPIYGLKRWSYTLMKDSILSMGLVLLYTALIQYSEQISSMIGADWDSYYQWLDSMIMILDRQRTILLIIYGALKTLSMSYVLGDLLGPILRMISYNLIGVYTYKLFGFFVQNYSTILLVLGIFLISIPFRIGRSAGAWMIAFSLVMYTALPAMPLFVSSFPLPEGGWNRNGEVLGIAYPQVRVGTYHTKQVMLNGILEAYYYNSTSNSYELISRYKVINGVADAAKPDRGLPGLTDFLTYFIVDGIVFSLDPFPVSPNNYEFENGTLDLQLISQNLLCALQGNTIVYRGNTNVLYNMSCSVNTLQLQLELTPQSYIEIRIPSTVDYQIDYSGNAQVESGEWSWNTLEGIYIRFYNNGNFTVQEQISLSTTGNSQSISVDEYYYLRDYLGLDLYSLHYVITNIFFRLVLLPLLYILILTLIVSNVAYLIAGRYLGYRLPTRL